jgi:hypothetical protein
VTGVMLLSQLPVALNQRASLTLRSSRPLCRDIADSQSYQKAAAHAIVGQQVERTIPSATREWPGRPASGRSCLWHRTRQRLAGGVIE